MVASRGNLEWSCHPVEENVCNSCFVDTKYRCIHCGMHICNKCSVFESEEVTPGWVACKSVGYCKLTVSKLYIIRQFITWKLQWYHDTNYSLQTWCIIALNVPVTFRHVWMFLCTSLKVCINPKVRLGLGLALGLGFIHIFGALKERETMERDYA